MLAYIPYMDPMGDVTENLAKSDRFLAGRASELPGDLIGGQKISGFLGCYLRYEANRNAERNSIF